MLKLLNINKSFEDKVVFCNFSCEISENKVTCIMGSSGSGKTTLINLILGIEKPGSGVISGVPDKISVVFQEDRLLEGFSVADNLKLVTDKTTVKTRSGYLLDAVGLSDSINTDVSTLSGGMRRRVALVRALIAPYDLLILDEPFKGLDENLKLKVMELIRRETVNKTVIIVTHDITDATFFDADILNIGI